MDISCRIDLQKGRVVKKVNGVKYCVLNEYPYFEVDITKDNCKRLANYLGLEWSDSSLFLLGVQGELIRRNMKMALNNNWRKAHGLKKISRKVLRKQISNSYAR